MREIIIRRLEQNGFFYDSHFKMIRPATTAAENVKSYRKHLEELEDEDLLDTYVRVRDLENLQADND